MEKLNVKKETIIRTAVLVLALVNNALVIFNKNPLPISDETVTNIISLVFTNGAALIAWWKNNSFTQSALNADDFKNLNKSLAEDEDVMNVDDESDDVLRG